MSSRNITFSNRIKALRLVRRFWVRGCEMCTYVYKVEILMKLLIVYNVRRKHAFDFLSEKQNRKTSTSSSRPYCRFEVIRFKSFCLYFISSDALKTGNGLRVLKNSLSAVVVWFRVRNDVKFPTPGVCNVITKKMAVKFIVFFIRKKISTTFVN